MNKNCANDESLHKVLTLFSLSERDGIQYNKEIPFFYFIYVITFRYFLQIIRKRFKMWHCRRTAGVRYSVELGNLRKK